MSLRPPLTEQQEARLIRHLDQQLAAFEGAFSSRHSSSSPLQSIHDFLDAILPLLSFILTTPAAAPTCSLRTSYLLQLTGFLAPAFDAYTLSDDSLDALFSTLDRFDAGWVCCLRGFDWDSAAGRAREEAGASGAAMRNTDRARLETLVREIKAVLAISLGLPEFVPLENDPFLELRKQMEERRQALGPEELARLDRRRAEATAGTGEEEEAEMRPASSSASTPSLVSDAEDEDDAMSVDAAVATPSSAADSLIEDDGASDEEGSDADFEEVPVPGAPSLSTLTSSTTSLPGSNAYSEPPAADGSFSIHFTGIPPPTLQDGELSLAQGATPIIGQARGFDPDEEYPPEDEVGERVGEEGMLDEEDEGGEDVVEEKTRERVKKVFEQTERVLKELRAQAV
ncbi:hypothetical protein JCM8097_006002 [Rhodosporidiobolus ruineniae]